MKKKLSVFLAALLCVFMLAACGEQEAYDLYTEMNEAMSDITSMAAKMDAQIGIEVAGQSVDLTMTMDMEQIIHSETDVEMAIALSMDMGELGALDMSTYFKDGWLYQDAMGMKMKMELSLEEAMEMANSEALSSLEFGRDAVVSSEVKSVSGGKQLSFALDGDKLTDALNDMVGSMMESLGVPDTGFSFGDVSYTLLLDNDSKPLEQRIVFDMTMEIEGQSASASYDMNITGIQYNALTSIDFPTDLDEYTEMTM